MATVGSISLYTNKGSGTTFYNQSVGYIARPGKGYITYYKIPITYSNDKVKSLTFNVHVDVSNQCPYYEKNTIIARLYTDESKAKSFSNDCLQEKSKYESQISATGHKVSFSFNFSNYSSDSNFYISIACKDPVAHGNLLEVRNEERNKASATITVQNSSYTVSYDANGGSGAPADQTKIHGTDLTLSSTKPTIGDIVTYPTGTITISYNSNGSTATAPDNGTGTYTNTKSQPRTFNVWNTNSSGTGTSYSAGGKYSSNASVTLYAQYKNNGSATQTRKTNPSITTAAAITRSNGSVTGYTVSFNSNDSNATAPNAITSTKTRKYTFGGWNTNTSGTGTNYSAATSYTFSANTTLYAKWGYTDTNNAIKLPKGITRSNDTVTGHKVTFNSNGSSETAPTAITSTKTRKYTFGGWNTNQSGNGTNYSAEGSYTPSAATTLYAKWTSSDTNNAITLPDSITRSYVIDATYKVTLNANKGSCPDSSLTTNKITSYTFGGWNTNASGTGTNYSKKASYTPSAATTLYAKWNSSTTTAAINLPEPTRDGYTFQGWYTELSAGSKVNNTYVPDRSITLYARWTANTYTVKYNGNGSTGGSTSDSSHTYDTSKKLTANGFTKTGYTFVGWSTTSSGSVAYTNQESVKNLATSGTVNLYAKWTPITYTIKYHLNDGNTDKSTTTTVQYDEANIVIIASRDVHKDKYDFKGWTTNQDGSSDGYDWTGWSGTWKRISGTYGIVNDTLNLYAIWERSPFKITYSIYGQSYTDTNYININDNLKTIRGVLNALRINSLNNYDKFVGWTNSKGESINWAKIDKEATANKSPRTYEVKAKIEPRFKIVYKSKQGWRYLTPYVYNGKWLKTKININKG